MKQTLPTKLQASMMFFTDLLYMR